MKSKFLFILFLFSNLLPAGSHSSYHVPDLNLGYIVPFIGMLLSIAVLPLIAHHFWEKHYGKISIMWASAFYIPFLFTGVDFAVHELFKVLLTEYIPFITLLFALYTISGGILFKGSLVGTTKLNILILVIGTVLASWMGTTGAAMLLIRPLLKANKARKYKMHTVIFFIFLVANIGGSLTPLGDPPLFLGFLNGVDFFWTTEKMLYPMLTLTIMLLVIYFIIDSYYCKKEDFKGSDDTSKEKIKIEGAFNFLLIGGVVFAVLLSGMDSFKIPVIEIFGNSILKGNLLRDLILLSLALISLIFSKDEFRKMNGFTWHPILEVAKLFIGIFITIIPAILILNQGEKGALSSLTTLVTNDNGENLNSMYFWLTGILSSFLDNAPTYMVFFNLAGSSASGGEIASYLMNSQGQTLLAISMGAVFMGAMTYIGNAPNFMVKSISEENGVKMPSFFGYMLWSLVILIPCFIIVNLIFIN